MSFWWRPLSFVLALGAVALLFSSTRAGGWLVFACGLLVYLAYHLRQLARLTHWLSHPEQPARSGDGLWGEAFYRLEKLLRVRQGEQQKVAADLEQMLEATRSLPDGVVILDQENRIVWLNDAAERLLGLSPRRDLGQFVLYLLRHSRFSEWLQAEDLARSLTLAAPAARELTLSMQIVPLPRQQKMLVARDITELARVEAMRRDFVANVSHELRTPITVILGFLEAFEDMPDTDPKEFRKHIPLMREQSDRIRRLVDDLLALAKLESEPETQDEAVDMPALARRLAEEAETLSQGRHQISLALDSQARLIGNSQELYSALANLVTNAVRYTPADGRIRIRWNQTDIGGASFSVADTGDGIDAQHIPRLTERFYRVDRGRSRATGGTGLGLAIVKHVLQRHQARLKVESIVGKGSTFAAQFPQERVIPTSTAPEKSEGSNRAVPPVAA
jgi:two-component system phosphate regulon sensor histidine kinase PhoR